MSNIAGKAYAMNVITPVPPGLSWLQQLIFMTSRALPFTLGHLLNLSLIHFARWVIIRRSDWPPGDRGPQALKNDYVLFCSNFNGTWDQYIDAFSDGNPQGLDAFWYASSKYPQSIPITPFKTYIAHNQFHTGYYYNATPGSGQRDIKAALRVYSELQALEAVHATLAPVAFRIAYNRALAKVQNCLGSPGYAPIASLDTEHADRNREQFLRQSGPVTEEALYQAAPIGSATRKWITSFDGGHCFLTVLLPIKTEEVVGKDGLRSSPVHMVRDALAVLPTAHQSPATMDIKASSPFATSSRTHFARFVVIDDVMFNGRAPADAIFDQSDRLIPNPVDQLNCPYLLLSLDLDARDEEDLRVYLHAMWREMRTDLAPVLINCFGYETAAASPQKFADYIVDHAVDTTMPFNDYWPGVPPLPAPSWGKIVGIPVVILAAVFALLWFGIDAMAPTMPRLLLGLWAGLPAIAAALYAAYRVLMALGQTPFPAAPNSDLASILKALFLQREFIGFAIAQQGASAEALHAAFGTFLAAVQVNNRDEPTQMPGTIPGVQGQ
jgi:hypothetical protein